MDQGCYPPETLAAYQEGRLETAEGEALERHGATCPRCQELLLHLGEARNAEGFPAVPLEHLLALRTRRSRTWRAAAALLLAAAGLGWLALRPSVERPGTPAPPAAARDLAPGPAPASHLGGGLDLLLSPGARATALEPRRLRVEAGNLWLESSGEETILELPGGILRLDRGSLAISIPRPPAAAWLLREALAGTVQAKVWLLEGEAEAKAGDRVIPLRAGLRLTLDGEAPRLEPCPAAELAALQIARAEAAAALPGPNPLGETEAPPAWRWVVVLSGRDAATEVGLTLGIAGSWHQWPVGLASQPPCSREIVEVAWDGARLSGRVNGRPAFSGSRGELGKLLIPAPKDGWGISVWGGKAVVAQSVLQETR